MTLKSLCISVSICIGVASLGAAHYFFADVSPLTPKNMKTLVKNVKENNKKSLEQTGLDMETSTKIYQLVKDVTEVMAAHKVTYWADGGTLLGAIRHKGVIPWDDDADLGVPAGDFLKVEGMTKDLARMGYQLKKYPLFGYKVIPKTKETQAPSKGGYEWPVLDIFVYDDSIKGRYSIWTEKARKSWPRAYFNQQGFFPLKTQPFGKIEIKIPGNAKNYLHRQYPKWDQIGFSESHKEHPVPERTFYFYDTYLLRPAPHHPLKDRYFSLEQSKEE